MAPATFRVVTRGLQPGCSPEMAANQIASLFKCSREQIAPLLGSEPVTVKKGVASDTARKYAQALERCGCLCSIEDEAVIDVAAGSAGSGASAQAPSPLSKQQVLSLIPVLRRAAPHGPEADPVVVRPFVGDLEVVFRTGQDRILVRQGMLMASMMSVEELYRIALWNLYIRVQPRLAFRQMAAREAAGGQPVSHSFSYIETGEGREASCLLLWPVWQSVAKQAQVDGPLRIAVPNPGTCLFCGADDAAAFAMMSDIASETWAGSGVEALSELTYSVGVDGRVSVVPGAHVQRRAPAPPATPLTSSAQLLAPVLHAQPDNAALLALSEDRLRQLEPRLFDLARWAREADRLTWLENIRHTLARGDSRAAVVVDAAGAIVASHTDELDCVVLLKFDPVLGRAHGWKDGARLLSANSYLGRDNGVAPDLKPGPGDTGHWGNVWPLIADLLTDDHAGLAARKQVIAEAEWERTWQLGRQALAERSVARDGRPSRSRQPVPVRPPAPPSASGAHATSTRKGVGWRRRTRPGGKSGARVRNAGIFGLCASAVWGALWRAANHLRGS